MRSSRFPALVLAAVCAAPLPALAQGYSTVPQPQGDADRLAAAMRTLGSNPQNVDALVTAAELSLRLGDAAGAASLFARADKVDPRNPRVKAGMGALLVHEERPGEALRYFNMAEGYGLAATRFAAERGLAYDLIGEQERAQRDYRVALGVGANPEVQRRYALSLGISGRKDEALGQLDALVRANDRGAWRARAFVLAMTGDVAGANKIATTMLPGLASGLAPFFERLPRLAAVDRAFAVHFGEVRPTPQRLADARLTPPLPALAPEPGRATMLASLQTVRVPVTSAAEQRRERREAERAARRARRSGAVQVAQVAPAAARSLPEPPRYTSAATLPVATLPATSRPPVALASVARRAAVPATVAATPVGGAAIAAPGAALSRPSATAPVTAAALPSTTSAITRRPDPAVRPSAPYRPFDYARGYAPRPPRRSAAPVVAAANPPSAAAPSAVIAAPTAATVAPARTAAVLPTAAASPQPGSAPAPTPARPPVAASAITSVPASTAAGTLVASTPATIAPTRPAPVSAAASAASGAAAPPPIAPSSSRPVTPAAVAVPTPASASSAVASVASPPAAASTVRSAAPALAAGSTAVTPPAPRAVASTTPVAPSRSEDSILARIVAGIAIPASELGVAAPVAAPAASPVPALASAPAGGPTLAARPTPSRRTELAAATPRSAAPPRVSPRDATPAAPERKSSRDAKADKPDAKPTPKPAPKPTPKSKLEPAEPARIWVQVAGGANEDDLAKAWKTQQGKAAALKGKAAYSTPLRATNRVVTGPFKTDAEARAFVNTLAKQGVSAFPFTSDKGQKMTRLGASGK